MTEIQKAVRDWVERNPLRRHRKGAGLTIGAVAAAIHVSSKTIQFWEDGGCVPSEENMDAIGRLVYGNSPHAGEWIRRDWAEWLAQRPKV